MTGFLDEEANICAMSATQNFYTLCPVTTSQTARLSLNSNVVEQTTPTNVN